MSKAEEKERSEIDGETRGKHNLISQVTELNAVSLKLPPFWKQSSTT